MIVTPSLNEIGPSSTIEMRSIRNLWPFAGAVDQDFVLMDGNALPCRACFVNEYTERKRNKMYGLSWPYIHVNLTRACMVQTPKTKKCSVSSTTDAGWPRKRAHLGLGNYLSFCNQKTDSQLHFMCTVVFDARIGQAIYLLNCLTWNM